MQLNGDNSNVWRLLRPMLYGVASSDDNTWNEIEHLSASDVVHMEARTDRVHSALYCTGNLHDPQQERFGRASPLSATAIIVPSVLLPVIALALAIFCMMRVLRRRKRRQMQDATKPYRESKYDQDLTDIDRSRIDSELDGTVRHELASDSYRPGAELSGEQGVQELGITSQTSELENNARYELMDANSRARLVPPQPPIGSTLDVTNPTEQTIFDNSAFERYPVVSTSQEAVSAEAPPTGPNRLTSLHAERDMLNQHIRQMQIEELLEQRRRIDNEIGALQS